MLFAVAVFAPLVGSAIAGLFGRAIGDRAAEAVTILCMILASVCGVAAWVELVYQGSPTGVFSLGTWVDSGNFHVSWALRYDQLAAVMVSMVTVVSTLIHIYSIGYMSHEQTTWRFFSYLSLFTFAMLMLVTADNLLQLFFGWEGVGLMSYLLIGYWYHRPAAGAAAIKAFIVNRIGDLGFALGIALTFWTFGSIEFSTIFGSVAQHQADTFTLFGTHRAFEVIGILLFIGAMGKSAQMPLHVWLPDAMEGPTPVSALIHAATMVTAGVFLMSRMSPVLDYAPDALAFVTFVGASTCLFAATVGCVQNDIKRVIAYSTCSQLGYMFIAAGIGAYQDSIFHLLTHAFFKALLFLGAGSVIHAMSDEQDLREMGGLAGKLKITCVTMWVGSLALSGIPPFAGYYSKDAILEAAWASGTVVGHYGFWCGLIAAGLTAFYSWRLLILTFHGNSRADARTLEHAHESPPVMTVPLILLAIGALTVGYVWHDELLGEHWQAFWGDSIRLAASNHILRDQELVPGWVSTAPTVLALGGIAVAYLFYRVMPTLPLLLASMFRPIYHFVLNKWYFDELYDALFVQPTIAISRTLWQVGDVTIIDGVPNGLAELTVDGSAGAVKLQTGSIAVYAFAMLIGLVVLVGIFLIFG